MSGAQTASSPSPPGSEQNSQTPSAGLLTTSNTRPSCRRSLLPGRISTKFNGALIAD